MPPMTSGPPILPPFGGGLGELPPIRPEEMPNILVAPPIAIPGGPPLTGAPGGKPSNGRQEAQEPPPDDSATYEPGPWCLGADAICQWLHPMPFVGPRLVTGCRVVLNVLCLLVGILLLVGIVAVLLFAFLQPG